MALLVALVSVSNVRAAFADEAPAADNSSNLTTVRVGYYESRNFLVGANDADPKSGYGYEYLQRAASYAGWRFEYVYGTWTELYDKLARGEIDLLPGVSFTEEHAAEVAFPSASMLNETFYVYRAAHDDSISGSDVSTLSGKRLGVVGKSLSERSFETWLSRNGISPAVVEYSSSSEMRKAFESGAIDAFISSDNVAYRFEDVIPTFIVGKEPYYLAVSSGRDDLLSTLNDVQSVMNSQDRAFIDELQVRYAADTAASAYLTPAEAEWMASHSSLTVGYLNSYLPFCDTGKNGDATGLMVDVLAAMIDSLPVSWDVDVTYRSYDDQGDLFAALKSGDIDVAFPVGGETWYAETNGFLRSTPVASPSMDLVYREGAEFEDAVTSIAVNRHNLLQQNFAFLCFPNASIVECDSIEECIDAVRLGRAGSTVINGLRAGALLSTETQLVSVQLPDSDDRCFGVRAGNGVLLQILNRGLGIIGENYGMNVSYRYTDGLFTYRLSDFVRDHWQEIAVAALIVLALVVAYVVRRFRKIQREKARKEEQNRALERALEQAERASKAKDVLLGNLSHDIRTPLNGILGVMESNASCTDGKTVEENISKARNAARQLLCLVDDLLEMSKLKSGDVKIAAEPFSLGDVMADVLSGVTSQAKEAGVSIRCKQAQEEGCESELACKSVERLRASRAVGSPTYVRQVLTNVFDNAIRYNKPGGSVTWDASLESGDASHAVFVCTVADTGVGMTPEVRSRLFEPFFQGEETARSIYPGSGLGMPIVGELVRLMGGSIGVESTPGAGTTITIRIPLGVEESDAAPADAQEPSTGLAGLRILLVEDNDLNLEITQSVLERKGAEVVTARNGEQAVRAFEKAPAGSIGAVVMDIMMPVMNGYEATRAIRALSRPDAATVPIVAMTANVFEDDRARALAAGMNEHLSKPLDADRLAAVLATLCA